MRPPPLEDGAVDLDAAAEPDGGAPRLDGSGPMVDGGAGTDAGSSSTDGGPDAAPEVNELYPLSAALAFGPIPNRTARALPFGVGYAGTSRTGALVEAITGPDASAFSVTMSCAGMELDSTTGNSCYGEVSFAPTRVGAHSAVLTLSASPGGRVDFPLSGESSPVIGPVLESSPPTLTFPLVDVGATSAPMSATITNAGDAPATGLTFRVWPAVLRTPPDPDHFLASGDCTTRTMLGAGESCNVTVVFAPQSAGMLTAAARLTDYSGRADVTVGLLGTGAAPAFMVAAARDFASVVVGGTDTVGVTVTNAGTAATRALTTSLSGGAASSFAIQNDTCTGRTLAPSASCTLDLRFRPLSAGTHRAALNVGDGTTSAATWFSGVAIAPSPLQISPVSHDFGAWPAMPAAPTPAPQVFTITNTGTSTTGAIAVTAPTDPTFTITTNTCAGATLARSATCRITVSFAPGTSAGAHSGTLSVSASPGGSSSAMLRGAGGAPNGLSLSPPGHNFGSVTGSESQTFTLTNGGASPRSMISATIAARAPELSITSTTCGGTLAPSSSCTIRVTYTASGMGTVDDHLLVRADGDTVLAAPISGFSL